ncbi:MAG: nucleoside triphosphate pyrophosphohydrolase [Chloroflexota bacterium]
MDFSLIPSIFATLRASTALSASLEPPLRLVLLDARTLTGAHVPPFPSELPALLTDVDSPELAAHVREVLLASYPREHEVFLVEGQGSKVERLADLRLSTFDALYIPPLPEGSAFETFHEIVAHLRAPEDGCPWDKEQTHQSLRTHLLEESYEALAALDAGDVASMREEFGDLLLQIVLHSQIAREADEFTLTDVVKGIHDKIVRRHPHVFGDLELKDVDGVLQNWERLKEKERGKKKEDKGLLDGVPVILPALNQAQEYQGRAARVGFDWPEIEGVLAKIAEEIEEVKQAEDESQLANEIGDLLFALVNLARWKKVDAESALRGTNMKFKKRFGYVEQGAKRQGRSLSDMSLEEMDALWNEAKREGM